jgi:DNA-binding CsgD family transcriptional regulator
MSKGCAEVGEPGGGGPEGSSDGREEEVQRNRALVDLGLDLRRLALSAFTREVARRVREVLGAESCEVLELVTDNDRVLLPRQSPISGGSVVIENGPHRTPAPLCDRGIASGISALVCANGRIFGILGAYSTSRRRYTEEEAGFLQNAAEILGVAVERALSERSYRRALAEEKRRADAAEQRYALLHEANAVLTTVPYGPAALVAVARLAVPALADRCFVELLEDGASGRGIRRLVVAHSGRGERLAREVTYHYPLDPSAPHGTPMVLRTGRPELIPRVCGDPIPDPDDEYLRWMSDLAPCSYLCVPLQVGLSLVGSIGLVSCAAGSGRRYGAEDLLLAESLARRAAPVVANILEETRRRRSIPPRARDGHPGLTPRQLEVLRLLDSGMRVHQIKAELKLSEPTVRTHVRAILRAFGAGSQLEALHKARALGFVGGTDRSR